MKEVEKEWFIVVDREAEVEDIMKLVTITGKVLIMKECATIVKGLVT